MRRFLTFAAALSLIALSILGIGAFFVLQNGGLAPSLTAPPRGRVQLNPAPVLPAAGQGSPTLSAAQPSGPTEAAADEMGADVGTPPPPLEGTPLPPMNAGSALTATLPAPEMPAGPTPTAIYAAELPPDVVNVLLVGLDVAADSPTWRTDSLIVVSIDRWNRTVYLLSIPRDLWVYIPKFGYSRINTADYWGTTRKLEDGGIGTLEHTIEYNLGIRIHRYARVNYAGFRRIVDTLGGLDITVDCAINDTYNHWQIDAGPQHMDGEAALRYARSRYTTSDFDRARRQQQVLRAIFDKALSLGLVPQIPTLWSSLTDAVQTDLDPVEALTLAYFGMHVQPENIRNRVISWPMVRNWTSPRGEAVLLLDQAKFRQMLATLREPPQADPVTPAETAVVEVLNGTGRDKFDEVAAGNLKRLGFDATATGTADRTNYRSSAIIVRNAQKTGTATRLAEALSIDPQYVTVFEDPTSEADIRVIVGANYQPCQR